MAFFEQARNFAFVTALTVSSVACTEREPRILYPDSPTIEQTATQSQIRNNIVIRLQQTQNRFHFTERAEDRELGDMDLHFSSYTAPASGVFSWRFREQRGIQFEIPKTTTILVQEIPFGIDLDNGGNIILASIGDPKKAEEFGNFSIEDAASMGKAKGLRIDWENKNIVFAGFIQ